MDKILSIVVPAYNVEKYIEKCLSSFEAEEILDQIEVLIVNDGSSDRTSELAQKYCDKWPDSFYLYDKENGGHGSTINCGIKNAKGKYFRVVDGDDWLNPDAIKEFVALLQRVDSDIVATDFLCIQDETFSVLQDRNCTLKPEQYEKEVSLSSGDIGIVIKMHSFTIKTQILQEHDIRLDEHSFYVDAEYITFPIPFCETVYFSPLKLYMYRLGRDGQSVNIKSMQKNRSMHMNILNKLLKYYAQYQNDTTIEQKLHYMEKCIGLFMENQFQIFISLGNQKGIKKELKDWDLSLKKDYPGVYKATDKKSIKLLRATNYMILWIGYLVYRVVK